MNDQTNLIENDEELPPQIDTHPVVLPLFFGLKFLPIILFFLPPHSTFLLFIFVLLDSILSQYFLSYRLVGLTWKINFPFSDGKIVQYQCEPDPYVPTTVNSNSFWITSFLSYVFWIITSLVSLINQSSFSTILFACLIDVICALNIVHYLHAYKQATKSAGDAVRSVLLGNDKFQKFEENDNSKEQSTDYSESSEN